MYLEIRRQAQTLNRRRRRRKRERKLERKTKLRELVSRTELR